MNINTKKTVGLILFIAFLGLNILHIFGPSYLILEDIKNGYVAGTGMEMMFLYPFIIELVSIPVIFIELIYFIIFRKVKYFDKANFIVFIIYIIQVFLFYFLLQF